MTKKTRLRCLFAVTLVTAIALLGCSGSGPSLGVEPTPATLQGIFQGTAADGSLSLLFDAIVLPDGAFYGLHCHLNDDHSICYMDGVIIGQGSTGANGTFNFSSALDYAYSGQAYAATAAATFVPDQSISGTISEQNGTIAFTANLVPNTQFNFATPAPLSSVVGTWSGPSVRTDFPSTLQVNADGTFMSSYVSGNASCNVNGKFVPNITNNYFNLSVSFSTNMQNSGTVCAWDGMTANGVAVTVAPNNKDLLWAAFAISGTTYGNAFVFQAQ